MEASRKWQRSLHDGISQNKCSLQSSIRHAELGFDCLYHICTYLELKDLLNAAQVSVQFRDAATYVFKRKYSKKRIEILRSGCRGDESPDNYDIHKERLVLTDSKTILQVLRYFGENITELKFQYEEYEEYLYDVGRFKRFKRFYVRAISYINQYCADSLKWVHIDPIIEGVDKMCPKPFSAAETVGLCMGKLDIGSLNRLFPKMKSLNFKWNNYEGKPPTIAEHYPHLQHFDFNMRGSWECSDLSSYGRTVTVQFEKNHLRGSWECSASSFFEKTLQLNGQIRSFSLLAPRSLNERKEPIHLPNVENFTYRYFIDSMEMGMSVQSDIAFNLDKLKVLTFKYASHRIPINYQHFIEEHSSIEKLVFDECSPDVFEDLEDGVFITSKSLKEISIESFAYFSIDCVIKYMRASETLNCLSFFCTSSEDHVKKSCGNEWEAVQIETPRLWFPPDLPFVKLIRK